MDGGQVTAVFGDGRAEIPTRCRCRKSSPKSTNAWNQHLRHRPTLLRPDPRQPRRRRTHSVEAAANDETSFGVGFDNTWTSALTGRMSANEKFAFELLDNEELRSALVAEYLRDIYKKARIARQRTCPIGHLIGPDREDAYLEYKSLCAGCSGGEEGELHRGCRRETVAGSANSRYGGALLVRSGRRPGNRRSRRRTTPPSPSVASEVTETSVRGPHPPAPPPRRLSRHLVGSRSSPSPATTRTHQRQPSPTTPSTTPRAANRSSTRATRRTAAIADETEDGTIHRPPVASGVT